MTTCPMPQDGGDWNFMLNPPVSDAAGLLGLGRQVGANYPGAAPTYPYLNGMPAAHDFANLSPVLGKGLESCGVGMDSFSQHQLQGNQWDGGFQPVSDNADIQRSQQTTGSPDPLSQVELYDRELWDQFARAGTEMIVTKNGRRMFPGYRIRISGLDPRETYCVMMDIVNVDDHRYKFQHGEWTIAGRGEPHLPQRFFLHPNSPATGAKWMSEIISFHKVKLTNSIRKDSDGMIVLNSMHRYQPRIHIVRAEDVSRIHLQNLCTYAFPQTVFFTVTAYQNPEVTKLKISNNPFAKGFREDGARSKISREASPHGVDNERNHYSNSRAGFCGGPANSMTSYGTPVVNVTDPRFFNNKLDALSDQYSCHKKGKIEGQYADSAAVGTAVSNLYSGSSPTNALWQPALSADFFNPSLTAQGGFAAVNNQVPAPVHPAVTSLSPWTYENLLLPNQPLSPESLIDPNAVGFSPVTSTQNPDSSGKDISGEIQQNACVIQQTSSPIRNACAIPGSFGMSSDSGLGSSPPTSPEEDGVGVTNQLKSSVPELFSPANL